ncbi:MAG: type III-A CRISPR-associated RAMP protein Csm5 [Desulfoarculaceae bacterium]|nr:type III-A CRISPR-associated RAMP protein Csm5 [Desulfoarculaceae bacterium]
MAYKTVDFRQQSKSSPAQVVTGAIADQTVYFRITTAAPLHIGCDEVYEPTSFVIDTKAKELVSFETASFLEQLDSDALGKFSTICKKGTVVSLLELFKFMRSQADLAEGQRIRVPEAFIQHYESTLNLQQNEVEKKLNKFLLKRTSFDPLTCNAYIPGSAIKGAIRTAVLNHRHRQTPRLAKDYSKMKPYEVAKEAKALERNIVGGSFETDPFRFLKVSDFFPVNDAAREIIYAIAKEKIISKGERDLYEILETIEPKSEFIGSITILAPPGKDAGIRQPLSLNEITKALIFFYGSEKQKEDETVRSIGVSPSELVINGQSLPLRIGRHSGAECVTLEGHRTIIVSKPGTKPLRHDNHATLIWLAAGTKKPTTNQGLKPFGWVRFEPLAFEEGQRLKEEAERKKAAVLEGLRNKITARKKQEEENREKEAAQQQKATEEAARLAAEETEKKVATEQERQALAAMTEAERYAYTIQKAGTPENEINTIYKKLDTLDPADQKIIAAALMSYWESAGKWAKNQCIPAQWEKVKKVKSFLIPAPAPSLLTPEEQAAVEQIEKLADWGAWKNAQISMEALVPPALKKLKEKFGDWKIKNVKGEKKNTWKALDKIIKQQ